MDGEWLKPEAIAMSSKQNAFLRSFTLGYFKTSKCYRYEMNSVLVDSWKINFTLPVNYSAL